MFLARLGYAGNDFHYFASAGIDQHDVIRQKVRYWHLADILDEQTNVRFRGQSRHPNASPSCPLLTQSGHVRVGRMAKRRRLTCGPRGLRIAASNLSLSKELMICLEDFARKHDRV